MLRRAVAVEPGKRRTETMRILQVVPRYAPAWAYGGGVHMFWLLAQELVRRGNQIEVVTSDSISQDERAASLDEEIAQGIHVRR